jgi:hypothetical protein
MSRAVQQRGFAMTLKSSARGVISMMCDVPYVVGAALTVVRVSALRLPQASGRERPEVTELPQDLLTSPCGTPFVSCRALRARGRDIAPWTRWARSLALAQVAFRSARRAAPSSSRASSTASGTASAASAMPGGSVVKALTGSAADSGCAISREFAVTLSSSARGLIRQFAALGPAPLHVDHDDSSGIPKAHHDPYGPTTPVCQADLRQREMEAGTNPRDVARSFGCMVRFLLLSAVVRPVRR